MNIPVSPEALIRDLDIALLDAGQTILLRRLTSGPDGQQVYFEAAIRANVRPLRPERLVGSVDQRQQRVILSPTDLAAAQFPMPPRKGDKAVIDGGAKDIEFVKPIKVADVLVRIELTVTG